MHIQFLHKVYFMHNTLNWTIMEQNGMELDSIELKVSFFDYNAPSTKLIIQNNLNGRCAFKFYSIFEFSLEYI